MRWKDRRRGRRRRRRSSHTPGALHCSSSTCFDLFIE